MDYVLIPLVYLNYLTQNIIIEDDWDLIKCSSQEIQQYCKMFFITDTFVTVNLFLIPWKQNGILLIMYNALF